MQKNLTAALLLALVLSGCAGMPGQSQDFQDEDDPEGRVSDRRAAGANNRATLQSPFEEGMAAYEAGQFDAAINAFNRAIDAGRLPGAQEIQVRKHIAFAYCATRRITLCRKEFREILRIDPAFTLSKAESGHPSWGPAFNAARKAYQSGRR